VHKINIGKISERSANTVCKMKRASECEIRNLKYDCDTNHTKHMIGSFMIFLNLKSWWDSHFGAVCSVSSVIWV